MHIATGSNQPPANLQADDKNNVKEILTDRSNPDKKLSIGGNLEAT
jgi:hypothetical protein